MFVNLQSISIILILKVIFLNSQQYTGPVNLALLKDSNAIFTCNTQEIALSSWLRSGVLLYQGRAASGIARNDNRFSLDASSTDGGKYNLQLNSIGLADSFEYGCRSASGQQLQINAYLIVIDAPMSCQINDSINNFAEGDTLNVDCSITFKGFWGPSISISSNRGPISSDNRDSGSAADPQRTVRRVYNRLLTADDNGIMFTAAVSFSAPPPRTPPDNSGITEYASNTPNYPSDTWNQGAIDVKYGPRNVVITPSQNRYLPGTTLRCSADGNPALTEPDFRWEQLDSNSSVVNSTTGAVYTVPSTITTYTLRCVATNMVKGSPRTDSKNITFEVFTTPIPPSTTPSMSTEASTGAATSPGFPMAASISIGVIGGILLIIIIIIIIVCVIRRNKRNFSKAPPGNKVHKNQQAGDVVRNPNIVHNSHKYPDSSIHYMNEQPPPYEAPQQPNRNSNPENLVYADLALEDKPRSRKPIQLLDVGGGTEYAEIQRPPPSSPMHDSIRNSPVYNTSQRY